MISSNHVPAPYLGHPLPMNKQAASQVFDDKQVPTVGGAEKEKWYVSIIDVISARTGNDRPRKYWNDLKTKLMREGSELSDKIGQLHSPAEDGKEFTWCLLRAWSGPMHIGRQIRIARFKGADPRPAPHIRCFMPSTQLINSAPSFSAFSASPLSQASSHSLAS